jgi:hypothetical protein
MGLSLPWTLADPVIVLIRIRTPSDLIFKISQWVATRKGTSALLTLCPYSKAQGLPLSRNIADG